MIRHLKITRDTAVKSPSQAMVTLKTLIINAPAELRVALDQIRGKIALIRHIAVLRPGDIDSPLASAKVAMRALARRWLWLHEEIIVHDKELERLTDYIKRLEAGGYIERHTSFDETGRYILRRDAGLHAPRIRPDGTPVTMGCGVRNMWRSMRMLKQFTPRDLALHSTTDTRTKANSPQINGICERFHRTIKDEFCDIAFRKKLYRSVEELQTDLDMWLAKYNEQRSHSGRYCYGKTPMQTFRETLHIAVGKRIRTPDQSDSAKPILSHES